MPQLPSRGLYVITSDAYRAPNGIEVTVAAAIAGGARLIQYRNKTGRYAQRYAEAAALCAICRQQGRPLIVNDDLALARAVAADGLHIGRHDASYAEARAVLGNDAIIGVSCYGDVATALAAQAEGADYVAFGRFFPSKSKPEAAAAEVSLLTQAKRRLRIPIVAIGGIRPENGALLLSAGADILAVIEGVFGAADVRTAADRYARLFSQHT
ncbi:MAG: thiamine phosphate synthase [Gammaproteobacteria bacterium]